MSNPIDLNQPLEMRDVSGRPLGHFVPAGEFATQFVRADALKQLETERKQLQDLVQQLTRERDKATAQVAQLQTQLTASEATVSRQLEQIQMLLRSDRERQIYLKSLHFMTRKDFTFTEEELRDLDENGMSLSAIIAELEKSDTVKDVS
jgi:chromosome segregation ATPase